MSLTSRVIRAYRLCNSTTLVYCIFQLAYILCKLLGLICYTFYSRDTTKTTQRKQIYARSSKAWRIYGMVLLTLVGCLMPFATFVLRSQMAFLRQNALLFFVGHSRYMLLLLCAFSSILLQLHGHDSILKCIQHILQLWNSLSCMNGEKVIRLEQNLWLKVLLKLFAFGGVTTWHIFLVFHDINSNNWQLLPTILFIYFCELILQMTLNMCFAVILLLSHLGVQHNDRLGQLLSELEHISANRRPWTQLKIQQHLWVSYEVQRLMYFHSEMLLVRKRFYSLYGVHILAYLAYVLIECIVQIFVMYFVAHSDWYLLNKSLAMEQQHRLPLNVYAVIYVMALIGDLWLNVCVSDTMKSNQQYARTVLSESWLRLRHKDIHERMHFTVGEVCCIMYGYWDVR